MAVLKLQSQAKSIISRTFQDLGYKGTLGWQSLEERRKKTKVENVA